MCTFPPAPSGVRIARQHAIGSVQTSLKDASFARVRSRGSYVWPPLDEHDHVMGDLTPLRSQLAQAVADTGATPVWFEDFGGRDDAAEVAYLGEVGTSTIYIGTSDEAMGRWTSGPSLPRRTRSTGPGQCRAHAHPQAQAQPARPRDQARLGQHCEQQRPDRRVLRRKFCNDLASFDKLIPGGTAKLRTKFKHLDFVALVPKGNDDFVLIDVGTLNTRTGKVRLETTDFLHANAPTHHAAAALAHALTTPIRPRTVSWIIPVYGPR